MHLIEQQLGKRGRGAASPLEIRRHELARDIVAAACVHGNFVYASGVHSDVYFDKYLFVTRPTILRRLAAMLADAIPPRTDRLAGAGFGATTLVAALSLETGLPFVIVRERSDGAAHLIEGELHVSERVVVIEDVVSTGNQAIAAARAVVARGGTVETVVSVIDREEGGAGNISAAGMNLFSLFTLSTIGGAL